MTISRSPPIEPSCLKQSLQHVGALSLHDQGLSNTFVHNHVVREHSGWLPIATCRRERAVQNPRARTRRWTWYTGRKPPRRSQAHSKHQGVKNSSFNFDLGPAKHKKTSSIPFYALASFACAAALHSDVFGCFDAQTAHKTTCRRCLPFNIPLLQVAMHPPPR